MNDWIVCFIKVFATDSRRLLLTKTFLFQSHKLVGLQLNKISSQLNKISSQNKLPKLANA